MPTVSVVMPAFNAARFIKESIASVLQQSYADLELIVVDDGSTDETCSIVRSFDDARVRLLVNDFNQGVVHSANRALRESKGALIARMDADDVCSADRIKLQADYLWAHPQIEILGGAIEYFGKDVSGSVFIFPAESADIHAHMLFYCPLPQPALMFRRRLVDAGLLEYDPHYRLAAEDYQLWSRLLKRGVQAANLPDVLLKYRLHPAQASSMHGRVQYEASCKVRSTMLAEAGVGASVEELALHESVVAATPVGGWEYLNRVAAWFERIVIANRETHYWDEAALTRIFSRKCEQIGRHLGLPRKPAAASPASRYFLGQSGYQGDDPVRYVLRHAKRKLKSLLKQ